MANKGGVRVGAGRPATGIKRKSICLSGTEKQLKQLKILAQTENKTVSQFIFDKLGIEKDK